MTTPAEALQPTSFRPPVTGPFRRFTAELVPQSRLLDFVAS
jgi:hypothetical protein